MNTRLLGKAGPTVSVIGLGCMAMSGVYGPADEAESIATIRAALEANNWNRQLTAEVLKINRTTLYKKMKKYGLEDEAERLGIR